MLLQKRKYQCVSYKDTIVFLAVTVGLLNNNKEQCFAISVSSYIMKKVLEFECQTKTSLKVFLNWVSKKVQGPSDYC